MKIFISWSGKQSKAIAAALNDWLQRVIQAVEPFYTPEMEKGIKWSNEIDDALEGTSFGIVCLTPDNSKSSWIHFEAGALSKTKDAAIWTFLQDLSPSDVPPPLAKFQHTVAEKSDVLKLLHSINNRLREVGTGALKESILDEIFEDNWTKLEQKLIETKVLVETNNNDQLSVGFERSEREILEEILEIVREQFRENSLLTDIEEIYGGEKIEKITIFDDLKTSGFLPGSHVKHKKYGKGLVLRREGSGENVKLTISFPGFGQKRLLEKFAELSAA